MDTDSFYLASSEESLEDGILLGKRVEWNQLHSKDCTDNFTVKATDVFSPELAVMSTRSMIRESREFLQKSLNVQNFIFATIELVTSTISIARDSIKEL